MKTNGQSMNLSGRIDAIAKRWELTELEKARYYAILEEVAKTEEACSACKGRESCPIEPPGLMPIIERASGELYLGYIPCAKEIQYRQAQKRERLIQSSRIPPLLKTKTFANFDVTPELRPAYEAALRVADNPDGRGIVLAGPTGSGKTHLAAAILNYRLAQDMEAVFVTVPELLADIRRCIKTEQDTSELLEIVKNAELLILDDLGAEKTTEWVTEQLFVLINARLLGQRQTVVTTNFESAGKLIEKLGGLAGQRIVSRLSEMCDWVRMLGRDRRLRN